MKISKKVTKKVQTEETVDILCNKCGKTCSGLKRYHNAKDHQLCGYSGLVETEVHGGYDSEFVGDMTSWKFSICEECLLEITKTFKIPHEIKGDYSHEYVTLKEYDKLAAKAAKTNHKEWIKAIKKTCKELGKKAPVGFEKQDSRKLYDIYHELQQELREKKTPIKIQANVK